MHPGGFNHAITIERKVQIGTKTLGDPNYVWETFVEPFAELAVVRGREHFSEQTKQRYPEDVWHFRVHYHDVIGIDATMRIVDEDGQYFDIKSIRPDAENRQDVLIECTLQDGTMGAIALMGYVEDPIEAGEVGVAYISFTVKAQGGAGGYSFAVTSGGLPTGLSLNSSSGLVSGTPTAAGSFSAVVTVTDSDGDTHVMPAIAITVTA